MSNPTLGLIVRPKPARQQHPLDFASIEPAQLAAIMREKRSGVYRRWAELCTFAQDDPRVAMPYWMRRAAVAGKAYKASPPKTKRVDQALARDAADLALELLDRVQGIEDDAMRMLGGIGTGIAISEIDWSREDGIWWPTFVAVPTRQVEWAHAGGIALRPDEPSEFARLDGLIHLADHPGKFWAHLPQTRDGVPTDQGAFRAALWHWLLKTWGLKFWTSAAERFSSPFVLGKVAPGTAESVREKLLEDLRELAAESVGVVEEGSGIEIFDAKATPTGEIWDRYIVSRNKDISIAFGVPPDLIDAGDVGSRAAVSTRNTLRLEASEMDASALWGSFGRDVLRPFLRYNAHLFGGRAAPLPIVSSVFPLQLDASKMAQAVTSGVKVRQGEYRLALGLEPIGTDEDNDYVKPPTADATPGGAPAESPFSTPADSESGGMPMLSRSTKTSISPTSSRFLTTPLGAALKS